MHFCQGVSWCGRCTVGYMMMTENVPKSKTVTATTAYYIGNCQALLMALVYFRFIGKDWRVPYAFATITLIPALIHLSLIPETPKYLYGKKKFQKCRQSLQYISSLNGKKMVFDMKFKDEIISNTSANQTISGDNDNFYTAKNVRNVTVFLIAQVGATFGYYMLNFFIKYIPGDIYANEAAMAVAENLAVCFTPIIR